MILRITLVLAVMASWGPAVKVAWASSPKILPAISGEDAQATAEFDTAGWSWTSPVTSDSPTTGFVRVLLTPEILDQSAPLLQDLRVLDASGVLAPFVIRRERTQDETRAAPREVNLIDRTFLPENHTRVTLDFSQPVEKNRITVSLSEKNFRRRALIEGGADGQTWETVAEDVWLFDISLPEREFKVDTLDFPINTFRYLRLTVYNMADDPRRVEIISAKASSYRKLPAQRIPVPVVTMTGPVRDEKRRQSVYDLDLEFRNLPLTALNLRIDDAYFYRGYEVLGRNTLKEEVQRLTESGPDKATRDTPWSPVHSGVFYRVKEADKISESVAVQGFRAPYRYLQLRIYDGDSPPLNVRQMEVFRSEISVVFDRRPDQTYALIGDNLEARAPDFDLARAAPETAEMDLPLAYAGPLTPLAQTPKLAPWTERHMTLIWTVLIIAGVLMLLLIAKNLRPAQPNQP